MNKLTNNIDYQMTLIKRGVERIIEEEELINKLKKSITDKKPLIVKLGVDPTAADLHLGHLVVFKKLQHFQILGHQAIFLIGDFTGRIGDPTGRDKTRPALTGEQIKENAKKYSDQISKIIDLSKTKIVFNSSWLKKLTLEEIIYLTSWITMSRLLEHNTFKMRFEQAESIRFHELIYPFLQAYDSVVLNADVELGGSDQTFNLTFGRDIQKIFNQEPQICITLPILVGTDGVNKMSKSLGNYIGINESPYIMFEKIMRMVDENIILYYTLITDKPLREIKIIESQLNSNPPTEYIIQQKKDLAFLIVEMLHGTDLAKEALESYGKQVKQGIEPFEIPLAEFDSQNSIPIIRLLILVGKATSKSEARRLVQQGAVSVDNSRIENIDLKIRIDSEITLRVGKNFIAKVKRGIMNELP